MASHLSVVISPCQRYSPGWIGVRSTISVIPFAAVSLCRSAVIRTHGVKRPEKKRRSVTVRSSRWRISSSGFETRKYETTLPVNALAAYSLSIAEQNSVLLRRRFQQVGKLLQTEIRKQGICRGTDARSAETTGFGRLYASFSVLHNERIIRLYAKKLCRQ